MCRWKSAVATKTDLHHHWMLDSHEDIIALYKLKDDSHHIVRVELVPGDDPAKIDDYKFCVDQDELPAWWSERKEAVERDMRAYIAAHIITDNRAILVDGDWVIAGKLKVQKVLGRIAAVCGSSRIDYVCGSASIDYVCDSASIDTVYDSARIDTVYDSARIGDVCDSARIGAVCGSSRIDYVCGSARIDYVCGSARIDYVCGSSRIDTVYDSARIGDVCDSARIKNDLRKKEAPNA